MKWVDPAWSPNYYAGANNVQGIVIHHAATTSLAAVAATFSTTARQASAHYGVDLEYVQQYVHEYDGAWHAGDYWANTHTIGIENVNSTLGPNWYVDERTVETCCELMADIAIRYDLYPLKRYTNVWGHKDFQSTYCPGVLYDRLDYMCDRANKIAYDKMHGEEPEVVTTRISTRSQRLVRLRSQRAHIGTRTRRPNGVLLARARGLISATATT